MCELEEEEEEEEESKCYKSFGVASHDQSIGGYPRSEPVVRVLPPTRPDLSSPKPNQNLRVVTTFFFVCRHPPL